MVGSTLLQTERQLFQTLRPSSKGYPSSPGRLKSSPFEFSLYSPYARNYLHRGFFSTVRLFFAISYSLAEWSLLDFICFHLGNTFQRRKERQGQTFSEHEELLLGIFGTTVMFVRFSFEKALSLFLKRCAF